MTGEPPSRSADTHDSLDKPPFVLLNRMAFGEVPAWDVVIGDKAVHYIPIEASAEEAQADAVAWLRQRYGAGDVDWEPAGDTAYIGTWSDA